VSVTVAIWFPLGRYHATPWDRSVNEGAVEWPPSPWRLLRTLVATWYTRWPELPARELDRILEELGEPPAYRTPETSPGHTRHYLPDLAHRTGATGNTDLTLDPYRWVPRDEPLLVRWEARLPPEQRETLAKLLELVPYLGRAESVCQARLLDPTEEPEPDGQWWRPGAAGGEQVRLLAPALPVRRPLLELGTVEVRKQRRTVPPETRWVTYTRSVADSPATSAAGESATEVDAIRFTVQSRAGLRSGNGVLLADEVHRIVAGTLKGGRPEVIGHGGAATNHQHAHWVPLASEPDGSAYVTSLLMWVPAGLTQQEVGQILAHARLRGLSGRRGKGYEVKGLPRLDLLLQAVGPVWQVAPELCRRARRWRSLTPYLPVRHHKPNRETLLEYLAGDVRTELGYRGRSADVAVEISDTLSSDWALSFRRYRMKEHLGKARRGYGLTLTFRTEVPGPLLLGQLSHFGYGIFVPDEPDEAA